MLLCHTVLECSNDEHKPAAATEHACHMTCLLVLIGSDRHKLGLWEDMGAEILTNFLLHGKGLIIVGLYNVDSRLVFVH